MVTLKRSGALTRWIAGAAAVVVVGVSAPAHAGLTTQTVKQVLFGWDGTTQQLRAMLNDSTLYYANILYPGQECSGVNAPSMDLVKGMLSTLQSALLSGKSVNLTFATGCSINWIMSVELVR